MVSEEIIFQYFLFSIFFFFCIGVSMVTSTNEQQTKNMADSRIFKVHFHKSFVKISAIALQKLPFFLIFPIKSQWKICC